MFGVQRLQQLVLCDSEAGGGEYELFGEIKRAGIKFGLEMGGGGG